MTEEASEPQYEEKFVDLVGARVRYLHAGSGTPVLLIHGLVGSSANWRNNIGALARNASVYAIDLVNIAKSECDADLDAGLSAIANRVLAVMDALHLAEADIVAHSHGGAVAMMLAALQPKRVRSLILFAPANPFSRSSDLMVRVYSTAWGGILAWMLPFLPVPIQRIALGEMYGGPDQVPDTCLQEIADRLRSPATLQYVLCVIRCWCAEMARLEAAIQLIERIPTLLVWGDRDCMVSLTSAVHLYLTLSSSELLVVSGGHSVFEDRAEESNRIIIEWLGRHLLSTPSGVDLSEAA
jgi:4,5:9,10-diseco-3-hydroxy-5,9,17-trioxoandrosta-1(10),2-diene-4-oate hydrolase